jgi:hypothetical protein
MALTWRVVERSSYEAIGGYLCAAAILAYVVRELFKSRPRFKRLI